MVLAHILINTKPGKEEEVFREIKGSDIDVKEMDLVYGEYDIVLKVKVDNIEDLRKVVVDKIRKMDGVERTTTLISAEL